MEKTLKSTDINYLLYLISEKEKCADMFKRSMASHFKEGDKERALDCKEGYNQQTSEIELIRKRIEEIFTTSKRIPNIFPIIDVPASGNANWCEGAYTLCFVYSKYKGNFILRGWRGEVMEYLKKNYSNYFCYISMWSNGSSRGHWKFWKENVIIFEPKKLGKRREWKYRVLKYSGSGMYERERIKELKFKRLPKRWIKEFDEL